MSTKAWKHPKLVQSWSKDNIKYQTWGADEGRYRNVARKNGIPWAFYSDKVLFKGTIEKYFNEFIGDYYDKGRTKEH